MGIVLLGQRVLREPAAEGRVVEARTEVVQVQTFGPGPLLPLVLQRLDARRRRRGRKQAAQRVIVVVFLSHSARAGHHPHRTQVVREEEMIRVVRHRDVTSVEQHPRTRPVLQHQRPRVVRRRGRARGRTRLAQLRSVGRITVVDDVPVREGHRLRKPQHVPAYRRNAFGGVLRHPARGIVGITVRRARGVGIAEVVAVGRTARVLHGTDPAANICESMDHKTIRIYL